MPRTAASDIGAALIGEEIRRARRAAGLTQSQVSERISATGPYISNVEAGRVNLTIGQLTRIVDALGCDLEINLVPLPALTANVLLPD
jgi:transcriptional regulator with XRE-family HTH domain